MRRLTKEELNEILENHRLCLETNFNNGELAFFNGIDLSGVVLDGRDLSFAKFENVCLRGASLCGAKLRYAFSQNVDLIGANLEGAGIQRVSMKKTDLLNANLKNVNLLHAWLNDVDFGWADLSGADFYEANLVDTKLDGVLTDESTQWLLNRCPEGEFVAWKKCLGDVLVKLLIPADAKRSNATTEKCRADKAIVLEVIGAEEGVSLFDENFIYRQGEMVEADGFGENRWNNSTHGIHFFLTKREAEWYDWC